jgi:hypothetical protein
MSVELIGQLEAAVEGSEELDALLIAHVVGGTVEQSQLNARWCVYVGRHGQRDWEPKTRWERELCLAYLDGRGPTRSFEAALLILPEGFAVERLTVWPGMGASCVILGTHKRYGRFIHDHRDGRWEADSRTGALAVCIAALKARNAETKVGSKTA